MLLFMFFSRFPLQFPFFFPSFLPPFLSLSLHSSIPPFLLPSFNPVQYCISSSIVTLQHSCFVTIYSSTTCCFITTLFHSQDSIHKILIRAICKLAVCRCIHQREVVEEGEEKVEEKVEEEAEGEAEAEGKM